MWYSTMTFASSWNLCSLSPCVWILQLMQQKWTFLFICLKQSHGQTKANGSFIQAILHNKKMLWKWNNVHTNRGLKGWMMWLQKDAVFRHLHHCSLFYTPPRLCKCVLFHCCVSLHKNSTTSWVRQMFYCGARQLLKWLASIWVPLLQLAATAESGQSISMRRIGLEWKRWRMGRVCGNRLTCCYSPREDDKL